MSWNDIRALFHKKSLYSGSCHFSLKTKGGSCLIIPIVAFKFCQKYTKHKNSLSMFRKIDVLKFFIKISEALETKILEQIFEYQKRWWAIPEKNAKLTDGQTDKGNFIEHFIGWAPKKEKQYVWQTMYTN